MHSGTGGAIVVVGATGGVGASTFATLLARRRARTGPVSIVDLGAGGGVDVLLGIERAPGARWPAFAQLRGTVDPGALDGLLPSWGGLEVLSADRSGPTPGGDAVAAVLAALRERGRTAVVDLSAAALGTEVGAAVVAELGAGGGELVLLAGQDVLGAAGAMAVRAGHGGPAHLVLRRRRSRVAPLEAAHVVDLPLLGLLPTDRRITDAVERGLGPQPGRRLSRAVDRIGARLGGGR